MKYTIELTDKQKAQMDCMMEIVHRYVGFNPKLEPIKTTNVEDTNEYQIGYKTGYDIAQTNAQVTREEWGKAEYNRGYNAAITDYDAMYEWLHDCFVDFKKFLLEKGFYTEEKFLDGFVVGQLMYDLICDHDIAEVISEFKKWQEEKKKAEEESIKVGDEVVCNCPNEQRVIITAKFDNWVTFMRKDGACYSRAETGIIKKTGRHFGEVEQLLDKLRGEE